MKVTLSDREMLGLWVHLRTDGSWGGDEKAMAAQLNVWDGLGLDARFGKMPEKFALGDLSDDPQEFELPDAVLPWLRATLSRGGQGLGTGLHAARALARLATAANS